jgi:hypothetical protein
MRIRLAEKLGNKAHDSVSKEKRGSNLTALGSRARVPPQYGKQQQTFQQKLVDLRWVTRQVAGTPKNHAPWQSRVRQTTPQLSIHEIADTTRCQAGWHTGRNKSATSQNGFFRDTPYQTMAAMTPNCRRESSCRPARHKKPQVGGQGSKRVCRKGNSQSDRPEPRP